MVAMPCPSTALTSIRTFPLKKLIFLRACLLGEVEERVLEEIAFAVGLTRQRAVEQIALQLSIDPRYFSTHQGFSVTRLFPERLISWAKCARELLRQCSPHANTLCDGLTCGFIAQG